LRCLGHDKVAVLDGGIKQGLAHDYELTTALPDVIPCDFIGQVNRDSWLDCTQMQQQLDTLCLIDARTPERYRGEQEPIDPIAGHIPHALNRAFQLNLDAQGLFLPAEILRDQFDQLIGDHAIDQVVHYCGSGVTACHNLLAMEYAGLAGSKLYAGSWSEWIRDKNRAIAVG
jgi:thiosulfate/3-mercaptopyruvate sulfurtransferase